MAEPVTGGDDYDLHRQLAIVTGVPPISHSASNSDSSSVNLLSSPISLPHDWIIQQVPRSTDLRVETMTPESKWSTTKFTLPEDWYVETVPRKSGNGHDRYYHDPETGCRFRSLKEVERYLTEGITPTRPKIKRPIYNKKMQDFKENQDNEYKIIHVTPRRFVSSSPFNLRDGWTVKEASSYPFNLPDGWLVKEMPRKTGKHTDRYYYEPGTGNMFRSLPSVKRYLAQLDESSPLSAVLEELREDNLPLSKAFKLATPMKNYGSYDSWKKSVSKKEQDSSFPDALPNKINWVIPNNAGESWNAFVGDEMVPDYMKQQWAKSFMLTIYSTKLNVQE